MYDNDNDNDDADQCEHKSFDDIAVLLMDELTNVNQRQAEYNKAQSETERDWSYYGRDYERNLEKAKEKFASTLKNAIDMRFEELFSQRLERFKTN
jgi:hypothetical protein